jgi:hypothetical protein
MVGWLVGWLVGLPADTAGWSLCQPNRFSLRGVNDFMTSCDHVRYVRPEALYDYMGYNRTGA